MVSSVAQSVLALAMGSAFGLLGFALLEYKLLEDKNHSYCSFCSHNPKPNVMNTVDSQ